MDYSKLGPGTHKVITIRKNGSKRITTIINEPSKTDPSFKDDCDVNNIIDRFTKTGQLTHINSRQGQYGDFSQVPDLLTALTTINDANTMFDSLSAKIQKRFQNSPALLMEFLNDPSNEEEAIKLGFFKKSDDSTLSTDTKPLGAVGKKTQKTESNTIKNENSAPPKNNEPNDEK